jgi:hypothetical protein
MHVEHTEETAYRIESEKLHKKALRRTGHRWTYQNEIYVKEI